MPHERIDLHALVMGHHIHADRDRRERAEQLRAHEVREVKPRLRLTHEQRAALGEPGQEFAGAERVGEHGAGVRVRLLADRAAEQLAVQVGVADRTAVELGEFAEQVDPRVQIRGEVVGVAHAGQIAGRGGDQIDFRAQRGQLVLEHHGGEDRCAGGDIAGAAAHGVRGHHAGARIAFGRGERNARLQHAGWVEQRRALRRERAGRRARDERLGQQVLEFPRLRGHFGQRVELLDERPLIGLRLRVDREHAGGVAHAQHLTACELPVHVAGERGEVAHRTDVRLVVEHRLIQMRD